MLSRCCGKSLERSMILYQKNDESVENKIYANEMFDVRLKASVKGKREISLEIISLIEGIRYELFNNNINNKISISRSIELALKKYESEISRLRVEIDFDVTSFDDKPMEQVLGKYSNMLEFFKKRYNIDKPSFSDMFSYLNMNLYDDSKEYFNDNFSFFASFLKGVMKRNWDSKFNEDQYLIHLIDIFPSLDILKFYCYFNDGLDDILFSSEEISLRAIFKGKYFDYS